MCLNSHILNKVYQESSTQYIYLEPTYLESIYVLILSVFINGYLFISHTHIPFLATYKQHASSNPRCKWWNTFVNYLQSETNLLETV